MKDWRTVEPTALTKAERYWLNARAWDMAGTFDHPTIVHLGVEFGASMYCTHAGAPDSRHIGVDLDTSKYQGPGELLQGDSGEMWRNVAGPVHLLFVDAGHQRGDVERDMEGWLGKIAPGGVVAFHDYHRDYERHPWTKGVREAVDGHFWSSSTWELLPDMGSIRAFKRKPYLRAGDTFGTIGIGVPYYKPVYEFFRWWTWLLVGGLEEGDGILNTANLRCEVPIPMAHNGLIQEFLRSDKDTLCMVEDDHCADQDIVRRMRSKPENQDFDIVCASYVSRRMPLTPNGYTFLEEGPNEYGEYTMCLPAPIDIAETGTQEYDGTTLGLVLIRRWLLAEMLGDANPEDYFWFDWRGRNSQDVVFYQRVHEMTGARVGVDRDARLGHVGKTVYTMEQYFDMRRKQIEKEGANNG